MVNLNTFLKIFGLIVLVLIGFLIFSTQYFQLFTEKVEPVNDNQTSSLWNDIQNSVSTGDFDKAIENYDALLATQSEPEATTYLEIAKVRTLLASGSQANIDEALLLSSLMIQRDDVSVASKAWIINTILDAYYVDRSPSFLAKVLTYEPFTSLSRQESLDTILEITLLGDKYAATSMGKIRLAFYYSGELLDNKNLDATTKQEYAQNIQNLVDASELLFQQENRISQYSEITLAHRMLLTHLQGFVLAAASVSSDSIDRNKYTERFETAIALANDNPLNTIMQRISLYSHFYYSAFLKMEKEASLEATADYHLQQLVSKIPNPAIGESFRKFIIAEYARPELERDHNYAFFESLKSTSPSLEAIISHIQ
jgi:hypothetical protein